MKPRREHGSALILALLISASAAIAGMWMVLTTDLRARANRYLARAADSTRNAESGLEIARVELGKDAGWSGITCGLGASDAGEVTVLATPAGVYRSSVHSIGKLGETLQSITAELRAPAHASLSFNVVSASTITIDDAVLGGHLRANGSVIATGDVSFNGTLETSTGSTVTSAIPSSQVAYVSSAIAPPTVDINGLAARCTPLVGVPYSAADQALLIERVRLSPASDPYGGVNAAGAYVLDAGGKAVVLRDSCIVGMLIVTDAAVVRVENAYRHERADASLPSLLADCDLELRACGTLDEAALQVDMNGDGDMSDVLPSELDGIVLSKGKLTLASTAIVKGVAMGQTVAIGSAPTLTDEAQLATTPVREFIAAGAFEIVAGSVGDQG